jgi:anti-anti-sigma regulatory factor
MYRAIIFDLSKIGRMEQSGLAWLVMFQRYTHSQKTRLTLVLGHWDIAEQCEQAGLNVAMLMSDTRSGLANAHPTAPNGGANHGTTGSVPAGSRC